MTPEGFLFDWKTLELFYRICRRYKVPDEAYELKMWLLRELVKRKKIGYIRDPFKFMKNKNVRKLE